MKNTIRLIRNEKERGSSEEKRDYWGNHYQTWGSSNLNKINYCKQHGLSPWLFYNWCKRFRDEEPNVPIIRENPFIAIEQNSNDFESDGRIRVELCLSGQGVLRFQISVMQLVHLVKELSHATSVIR